MSTNYIRTTMHHARYETLGDGTFYGNIPGFQGVYANTNTLETCQKELEEVLEEWILLRVDKHLPLPAVQDRKNLLTNRTCCDILSVQTRNAGVAQW